MADRTRPALGLSIGATSLAAVTTGLAIVRKPVLTLYRRRPPEVGVPSENPRLDEPGLVITDFVDRVGDPVGIVAADGSVHRSEVLLADGLRALAYAATGGRPLPDRVAVTYPAHWSAKSVDAVSAALSRVSEWSDRARPLLLIPDAAAALFAARANPGLPARGTVAVCDIGGSGTSITLMDAAGDLQPVAPTVRHHDFSGDMIDQALLTAVMDNMPAIRSFDPSGTSAIGSLGRLRTGCRSAKEQLSSNTVTTLNDELLGIRVTRNELDDAIRGSLNNLVAVLDKALARNGIRDLVAVLPMGGGANIPAVVTTLSGHLRVPAVTTPRPRLTAAVGAALRASRGSDDTSSTPLAPATAPAPLAQPPTAATATREAPVPMTALAWPKGRNNSRVMPVGNTTARAALKPEEPAAAPSEPAAAPSEPSEPETSVIPRQRRRLPWMAVVGGVAAVMLVGVALAIGWGHGDGKPTTTQPGVSTTPALPPPPASAASSPPAPAPQQPPPPSSSDTSPPATTDTPTTVVPQASPEAPAPPAPAPARAARPIPPIPRIPPLPPIPGINEPIPPIPGLTAPIPGLAGIPGLVSQIVPRGH